MTLLILLATTGIVGGIWLPAILAGASDTGIAIAGCGYAGLVALVILVVHSAFKHHADKKRIKELTRDGQDLAVIMHYLDRSLPLLFRFTMGRELQGDDYWTAREQYLARHGTNSVATSLRNGTLPGMESLLLERRQEIRASVKASGAVR